MKRPKHARTMSLESKALRVMVAVSAVAVALRLPSYLAAGAAIPSPGMAAQHAAAVRAARSMPARHQRAPRPRHPGRPLGSSLDMAAWRRVAQCETGQHWSMQGPRYSGGLGISALNWRAYGGLRFARTAGDAGPREQVIIARRIEGTHFVPDQHGCASW